MRKLQMNEVTFTWKIEPDDTPLEGNVQATEDPEADKAAEREIAHRLRHDDYAAWCGVVVEVRWVSDHLPILTRDFKAGDSVWGVTFTNGWGPELIAEVEEFIESHGMKELALENLNKDISDYVKKAKEVERLLADEMEQQELKFEPMQEANAWR